MLPPPPHKRVRADTASEDVPRFLAFVSDAYAVVLRQLLYQQAHDTHLPDPASLNRASDLPYDAFLLQWTEVVRTFPHVRDREATLWRAIRRAPAPALILLDPTADPFPPLLELGMSGAAGLLLQGVHDIHPTQFTQRLLEASRSHRIRRLLPSIAGLTDSAPEAIHRTLASLVQNPARFADVKDLASAACCTTRTLERQFHALGISSPRALLACVRLAHLHVRAPHESPSLSALVRTLGFHSASTLLNTMLRISGCGTLSAFLALPAERLMQRFQAVLQAKARPDR